LYKDRFLSKVRNLELVKIPIEFESLGGIFNCPTRFTDIVKRAGWESGIKMIPAINNVITMLQSTGKLGREDITASMSDRLQSDDGDVVYRFCPGNEGYQLITYHIFE
jgi:hypothetical protein